MLSFVLAIALQSKTVNYDIFREDKLIGDARILIRITQDGGKRTDTKLTLKQNGKTLDMHTTQVWAFSGRPVLKIVQIFDAKGAETNRTRIDFKATEAVVTKSVDGKVTKNSVAIEGSSEIRDLTEFWFIRDEPDKGKPYEYLTFDASSLKWEKSKSIYVGKETKPSTVKKRRFTMFLRRLELRKWTFGSIQMDFLLTEAADKTKIVAKF